LQGERVLGPYIAQNILYIFLSIRNYYHENSYLSILSAAEEDDESDGFKIGLSWISIELGESIR